MAGSPTPYAVGFAKDNDWILGSTKAWVSDNAQAKCGFLELNGTSLASLDKGIEDKERQMAALGARMLESTTSRREAFETVQIRQSGDVGALSELTIMCTQTLSKALCWVAWWLTVEPTPESMSDTIHVELNSDFVSARLDAPTLTLVLQAFLSTPPAISYHTFFNIMQKGEIIDAEITEPQELAAIQQIIAERAKWAKEAPPGPPAPPPGPPAPGSDSRTKVTTRASSSSAKTAPADAMPSPSSQNRIDVRMVRVPFDPGSTQPRTRSSRLWRSASAARRPCLRCDLPCWRACSRPSIWWRVSGADAHSLRSWWRVDESDFRPACCCRSRCMCGTPDDGWLAMVTA